MKIEEKKNLNNEIKQLSKRCLKLYAENLKIQNDFLLQLVDTLIEENLDLKKIIKNYENIYFDAFYSNQQN